MRRGVFLSFASGMLVASTDPLGRHRSFLALLVWSGFLHSVEMGMDNLLSARSGGVNGNVEHLYGDVLGWLVIAMGSAALLSVDRWKRRDR